MKKNVLTWLSVVGLGFVATLGLVTGLAGLLATACGASFEGPATSRTRSYDLRCGQYTCDPRYYECSVSKPPRCEYVGEHEFGAARDAGRD
jgi:hypothetical protein